MRAWRARSFEGTGVSARWRRSEGEGFGVVEDAPRAAVDADMHLLQWVQVPWSPSRHASWR